MTLKLIGNLSVVCAMRPDVSLQVHNHGVSVYVGQGPHRTVMTARWDDDAAINHIIRELNFGAYALHQQGGPISGTRDRDRNCPVVPEDWRE